MPQSARVSESQLLGTTQPFQNTSDDKDRDADNVEPYLILVAQAGCRRVDPLCVRLDAFDEVNLGRDNTRSVEIECLERLRSLNIGLTDMWMSSRHATIRRERGRWSIFDENSKNGTMVNGRSCRGASLRDGDVIELGHTYFVFRDALTTPADTRPWHHIERMDAATSLTTAQRELNEKFRSLTQVAASKVSIVISGPPGSGKKLIARTVHLLSGRQGHFVTVDCSTLTDAQLDQELFGDAHPSRRHNPIGAAGALAASSGGTLFIEHIDDLSMPLQSKLLRTLQQNQSRGVSGFDDAPLDLRIVCASRQSLEHLALTGRFSELLIKKLSVHFELPSVRERIEDLGLLIDAVLDGIAHPRAGSVTLTTTALRALLDHSWADNIRELKDVLECAVALTQEDRIDLPHLSQALRTHRTHSSMKLISSEALKATTSTYPGAPHDDPSCGNGTHAAPSASLGPCSYDYDAYVAYRRDDEKDRMWVETVMVPYLESAGLKICLEHRDFRLGLPRLHEMERSVMRSKYTVAVFTPSFMDGGLEGFQSLLSLQRTWETGRARFIPVLRKACRQPLSTRMASPLDLSQDFDVEAGLERLAQTLQQSPSLHPHVPGGSRSNQ